VRIAYCLIHEGVRPAQEADQRALAYLAPSIYSRNGIPDAVRREAEQLRRLIQSRRPDPARDREPARTREKDVKRLVSEHLAEARRHLARNHMFDANGAVQKALALEPDNADARALEAQIQTRISGIAAFLDSPLAFLKAWNAAQVKSVARRAREHLRAGLTAYRAREFPRGEAEFAAAIAEIDGCEFADASTDLIELRETVREQWRTMREHHFGKARADLVGRVFFLEDYDIDLARDLVQGADIWLNTPTRMLEASGTSGMKAAANGCLNLSIGDGWWPEAFDGTNGWLIAGERVYEDQELQNQLDATTLYRLLEEEIVPSFFERNAAGVPERWIRLMRGSLSTVPAQFNTDRMVGEYASQAYRELGRGYFDLSPEAKSGAKSLAHQKARIRQAFSGVRFVSVQVADLSGLRMGDSIDAQLQIDLGSLTPDDVVVELVLGNSADALDLHNLGRADLTHVSNDGSVHTYEGGHEIRRSGSYAYGIRVRAQLASDPEALGDLVLWA